MPTKRNVHPHINGEHAAVVYNGIIENHGKLPLAARWGGMVDALRLSPLRQAPKLPRVIELRLKMLAIDFNSRWLDK
jgi:hypothetical protein